MRFIFPIALTAALLIASTGLAAAAPDKRVYRIDSVIATTVNGTISLQTKGAVQSGGWTHPRLKILHSVGHTLVVEFVAQPPAAATAVIAGLLPVTAAAAVKASRGIVAVRAMAEANEITVQILH